MIAFGRLGELEDIARVVLLLASGEAAWVTGQTLRANGGSSRLSERSKLSSSVNHNTLESAYELRNP